MPMQNQQLAELIGKKLVQQARSTKRAFDGWQLYEKMKEHKPFVDDQLRKQLVALRDTVLEALGALNTQHIREKQKMKR